MTTFHAHRGRRSIVGVPTIPAGLRRAPAWAIPCALACALGSQEATASEEQAAGAMALPEVEILASPLDGSARARAAQSTVVDTARFAGEGRTVAELLATAPGVTVRQTGPGQLSQFSLRGATADQSLILLDGIPLQGPGGGSVDLTTLPAALLSQLIISRGVLGAQLGAGAMGGAVEVIPLSAQPPGRQWGVQLAGGSFGTAQLAADVSSAGGRLGTWSAGVQLDRTAGDFPYARQLTPEAGGPFYAAGRENSDSTRASALVRGAVPVGAAELDLLFQASAGRRGLPGAIGQFTPAAREGDQSGLLGARVRTLVGDAVVTTRAWVRGSLIQLEGLGVGVTSCADPAASPTCAPHRSHSLGARAEAEVGVPFSGGHFVTASLSSGAEWVAGDFTGIHRRGIGSLALADDWSVSQGALSVHPALRLDLVGKDLALSPGLGAVLRPFRASALEPLEFKAGAGASFRPPSFSELYLDQGATLPNPDLRPERAVSLDAGSAWRGEALTVAGSVFWSSYRNLILYQQDFSQRVKPQNDGAARIAGAELQVLAKLPLSATAELAYSYLDAVNQDAGSLTQGGQKLPYRPPHRLFARLARHGDRLEAFFQGNLTSAMARNAYGTADLSAQLRLDAGAGVRLAAAVWLDLEVRNLLDDRTQQDLFAYPLPGLSLLATARARF